MAFLAVLGLVSAVVLQADAAQSTTTVSATIPSSTTLAIDPVGAPPNGCQAAVPGVTSFGAVLPGSSAVTPSDCNVAWGSSNDTSLLRLFQSDGSGSAMGSNADPAAGTIAFYAFDGDWTDDSANANAASPASSPEDPAFGPGRPPAAQSASFDGSDIATAPHHVAYANLDTFTVDAWINAATPTGSNGTSNWVTVKGTTSGSARNFGLGVQKTGAASAVAEADISAGGVDLSGVLGTTNLVGAGWTHVAMVVDSAPADPNKTLKLYVNGVQEGPTRTFSGNVDNPTASLKIGDSSIGSRYFNGNVSELRVLGSASTSADLLAYMTGSDGPPDYDDDNLGAEDNWSEGDGMFGACLRALSGAGVVGTWTVSPTCPIGNGSHWNPISPTNGSAGAKIAGSPTSGTNDATASLRFGVRFPVGQAPGDFEAPLTFEVIAPNA